MKDPRLTNARKWHHASPSAGEPQKKRLGAGTRVFAVLAAAALAFPLYHAGVYLSGRINPPPAETPKTAEPPINDAEWQEMAAGLENASA